jgi:spermidine synthase
MGMTLPLMVDQVCRGRPEPLVKGIWLYALNTMGGVVGLGIVVGFSLHTVGVRGSMVLMMGLNLGIALACAVRDRTGRCGGKPAGDPSVPASLPDTAASNLSGALGIAFFSGAGVLALEVLALHLINLEAPLAFYPPAVVLACFIFLLGIGAAVAPWIRRLFGTSTHALSVVLALSGFWIGLIPLLFTWLPWVRGSLGHAYDLGGFLAQMGLVTLVSTGPAVWLAGMVFPLGVMVDGGAAAGRRLGYCLALNGVGGLLGAEAAQRGLLPWFGVPVAIGIVGMAYGILALGLGWRLRKHRPAAFRTLVVANAGMVFLLAIPLPRVPLFQKGGGYRVLDVACGPEGSLAVVERDDLGRAMVFDNQYVLGNSGAAPDMERQAHLPLLLHAKPERIAFIGLATGITTAGAFRHGPVTSVTAIELSPMVARASAAYFGPFNRDITGRSNATVLLEDARTHLAAARNRYDAVIGDLFTPWRPAEAALCSREQFMAVRKALRPGGVYCQWIPMHQLTPEQFQIIVNTFQSAFPEVHLFRNHFKARNIPLGLVGFQGAGLAWSTVAQRCAEERIRGSLTDPICRHPEGMAMLYLGRIDAPLDPSAPLNTLGNLRIELDAGRKFILRHFDEYFFGPGDLWQGLLRKQLSRLERDLSLPESLRRWPSAGLAVSAWESARMLDLPNAGELRQRLGVDLPASVLSDALADWSLWPGTQPPVSRAGSDQ